MAIEQRHEAILQIIRSEVFVDVETLAARLGVTPQTIRRDVKLLAKQGLVRRYHGGASLPASTENIDYATRSVLNLEGKRRIAAHAAAYVPDRASLIINLGTTTEEVARVLTARSGLRVITNNTNIAAILGRTPENQVVVAGGVVRARDLGITGEPTIDCIRQFKVDLAIVGISGIDDDGTLRDFDLEEVQVSRAIMHQARCIMLVADHTKFGRHALVRLGHLSDVDVLITDCPPPEPVASVIKDAGVRLVVADDAGAAPSDENTASWQDLQGE